MPARPMRIEDRPISRMGTLTVVRPGTTSRTVGTSSKPTTDMSSGTRRPASLRAARAPRAGRDLLDARRDLGEKRIGHVVDDDADHTARSPAQGLRVRIANVAE